MTTRPERTACHMPGVADAQEADLYGRILEAHCDRKQEPDHECRGAITIRRRHITMTCPLCGDARKNMP